MIVRDDRDPGCPNDIDDGGPVRVMNLLYTAAGRPAQSFQDSAGTGDGFSNDLADADMARGSSATAASQSEMN